MFNLKDEMDKAEAELQGLLGTYSAVAYQDLTISQVNYLLIKFIDYAKAAYSKFSKSDVMELLWCKEDALVLVEQVWKRKIYFRIYHKNVRGVNELKEAALYSFWILKLQPFYLGHNRLRSPNKLNGVVALRCMLNGALAYAIRMNRKEAQLAKADPSYKPREFTVNVNHVNGLYYSFIHRDLSKEALMDLAESMIIVR